MILLFTAALAALFLGSCSSQTGRYLSYRIAPDRIPQKGENVVFTGGVSEDVVILLDEWGVPHIRAGNEWDLYYGLGYMQGRDRRFQLEMLKMISLGRMRELIGASDPSGVMTRLEVFSRMNGFYQDAETIISAATEKDATMLQAFAAGVNAATEREPLPMEFRLLDYTPEKWRATDSAAIIAMTAFGLCKNWEHEVGRLELILHQMRIGKGADRALAIWKPRYHLPPYPIGETPDEDPFAGVAPIVPELLEYLETFVSENPNPPAPGEPAHGDTIGTGPLDTFFRGSSASNNWAVDGNWTGTGKAAFGSDPHMPHLLPPLGYLMHLECVDCEDGGFEVIGGTFAGLPAVAFGTNGHVAWGATSNWADVADVYVEKPVAGKPDYYQHEGAAKPFTVREEIFKIRRPDGGFDIEKRTVRETVHGVLVNDFVDRLSEGYPMLALSRNRYHGRPITAIRNLNRSKDVFEAREAMFDFYTMIGHWTLADDAGNIGYVGSVKLPKRIGYLGTIPVPGWTGTYDRKEYFSIEELPWTSNPPAGYFATANNQVIQPESFGYPINFEGNVPFRYVRIADTLAKGRQGMTPVEAISKLHVDNRFAGWNVLGPVYKQALAPLTKQADTLTSRAAAALVSWDGHMVDDAVGPTIFNTLTAYLLKRNMTDEVAAPTLRFLMSYFNLEPFVYDMLSHPDNPAWDDLTTPEPENAPDVIRAAFTDSVASLVDRYGDDVAGWTWGKAAPYFMEHPFGGEKGLTKHVNRGPFPTMGGTDTVFPHQHTRAGMNYFPVKYGPVLRVNVDFDDLQGSIMSLPGGQSGRPTSPHYDDLIPYFLSGTGIPMDLDMDRVEARCTSRIVLSPGE